MCNYVSKENNYLHVHGEKYDLDNNPVYVLGFGKASAEMGKEIENIIGIENIVSGLIITTPTEVKTKKITLFESSHPTISKRSFVAGKKLISFAKNIKDGSLIICLVSGGGSALIASPKNGISEKDKMEFFRYLLLQGINEIDQNIVRKSISSIKGGGLAKLLVNKNNLIINLVLMDNPYDYKALSSGPTFIPEYKKTAKEILNTCEDFNYKQKYILRAINQDEDDNFSFNKNQFHDVVIGGPITPKNSIFKNASIICDKVWLVNKSYYGQDIDGVKRIFFDYFYNKYNSFGQSGTYAVIANGEIPVKVPELSGKGGRNQHFAALILEEIMKNSLTNVLFCSYATDGCDFLTGVRGAMVSDKTVKTINDMDIDLQQYIKSFDTYHLHEKLGTLIKGDLTGTNCSDLYIFLWQK